MFFIGHRTTARLELATPLDCCCNCGRDVDVGLVETPLRQVRFYLVFGTEVDLRADFPYCAACRRSASRVRPGVPGTLVNAALVTAILFFVLVMAESALPRTMRESPFRWSLALALVLSFAYVAMRGRRGSARSYYQPVRLAEARVRQQRIEALRLQFANAEYGGLFARANSDRIATGELRVEG